MSSIILRQWEIEHVYFLLQESDARASLYRSFAASTFSVMIREIQRATALNQQIRQNESFVSSAIVTSLHRLVTENGIFRSELASRSSLNATFATLLAEAVPVPVIQQQHEVDNIDRMCESTNSHQLLAETCERDATVNHVKDSHVCEHNSPLKLTTSLESELDTHHRLDGSWNPMQLLNEVDYLRSANERLIEENRYLRLERESAMETKSLIVKQLLEVQGYRAAQELGAALRDTQRSRIIKM